MVCKVWLFTVIYNLSLFALIGFSIWYSHSLLPLFAIIFSLRYSQRKIKEEPNAS